MAERPPAAPPPLGPPAPPIGRATWALLGALVLAFSAWIGPMGAGLDPTARDQVHDLSLSLRIREGTALSDDNRHPALPALLAPVARREPGFFEDAWWISVAVSALALLAVGASALRVFGPLTGLATTVVFALELRLQARRICPEPLVAACLALAASTLAQAPFGGRPRRGLLSAGAWTGAAWLAKGSALLSLGAAASTVLASWGRRGPLRRPLRILLLLAGFVAVAWPLMGWNLSRGHGPTYNVNSAHVMWEDAWDEGLDRRSVETPARWFARHGALDAVRRLGSGLVTQRGVEWLYAFLGVTALAALLARRARGAGARPSEDVRGPRDAWRTHALATTALWLPAFAWYAPIVASRRLLFPCFGVLLPPTLHSAGCLIAAAAPRASSAARAAWARSRRWALPAAAAVLLASAVVLGLARPSRAFRGVDPVSAEVARDLRTLVPAGSRVLLRPSRTVPPDWLVDDHVAFVPLPSLRDDEAARALPALADYVLVSEGLLRNRPTALAGLARWDEATGVVPSAVPNPAATVVRRWPAAGATRYVLLRVGEAPR